MIFPRSNYEILCRIVKESALSSNQALDVNQVAAVCGWDPTVILANLGFLRCIGVFSTCFEKKIMISGLELANALNLASEAEIKECWRRQLIDSGVLSSLFEWLQKRNGIDQTQYLSGVAILYGRRISIENSIGIKRLTSILCELNILDRQNGRVALGASCPTIPSAAAESQQPAHQGNPNSSDAPRQITEGEPQAPLHLHFHLDPESSTDSIEYIFKNAATHFQGSPGIPIARTR